MSGDFIRPGIGDAEVFQPDELKDQLRALIVSQDDLRIRLGQMKCERDMWHARFRIIYIAALDYFNCAAADEAEVREVCVSDQQHDLARNLKNALNLTREVQKP